MIERKEVKLPSGAVLRIQPASFELAKNLYQVVLEEAKSLGLSADTELASIYKDLFCIGFSSKKIEAALNECLKVCTYDSGAGELKIGKDTFEPIEAREDYWQVCIEVAKENIYPFVKSLYVQYGDIFRQMMQNIPA